MKLLPYLLFWLSIRQYCYCTAKHLHPQYDEQTGINTEVLEVNEDIPEENIENKYVFEGDIFLDRNTQDLLKLLRRRQTRNAISEPNRKWPSNVIPYNFGAVSWSVREAVKDAIRVIENHTCIRFVQREKEKDYMHIVSVGKNCWSSIGRSGGRQRLSLGNGCERRGTAIHELMHALGFFHEQSRLDRDKYVTIKWSNIEQGQKQNFNKYSHGQADPLNLSYDYGSIMHYPRYAFSGNGYPTIIPKESNAIIGQRSSLSQIDIKKINTFYNCSSLTPTVATNKPTATTTTADHATKRYCRNRNSYCRLWARAGYCQHRSTSYKSYMAINCRKSCNFC